MQWRWPDPLLLQDKDQAEHGSRKKTWNCDDDGGDDDYDDRNCDYFFFLSMIMMMMKHLTIGIGFCLWMTW